MPAMAGPSAGAAKIQIPRWIQLVGLPILLLLLWVIAGAARHVVFLFLVAALIAFLLNPIVRMLTRVWIPRGFGVALVYLSFLAILLAAIIALGSVVVDQTKSSANRVNDYFTVDARTPRPHARGPRRRPLPALARHPPARRDRRPEAGPRPRPADPQEGRHALHGRRDQLRRGRRDRDAQVPVRARAGDRGLDLHAARHAAPVARSSTGASRRIRARTRSCTGSSARWRATSAGSCCSR